MLISLKSFVLGVFLDIKWTNWELYHFIKWAFILTCPLNYAIILKNTHWGLKWLVK